MYIKYQKKLQYFNLSCFFRYPIFTVKFNKKKEYCIQAKKILIRNKHIGILQFLF